MFKSLKIYIGCPVDLEGLYVRLVEFGYKRQKACREEGDFAPRGSVIDIFPSTFELPVRLELDNNKVVSIRTFNPSDGTPLWAHKIVIVLPFEARRCHRTKVFSEEFPLDNFVDLEVGDYVVHNRYGIGRFRGLKELKVKEERKDHLVIEYHGDDKLYVPVESMHLVQKYIAFAARHPKLNSLGSKEWQRVKARTRKGIQKLAWDLLTLQAMRMSTAGFKYSPDTDWQEEFEASFPYKETPDQEKAAAQVKLDMESPRPMDRLLCGDVGYGKTEVAMRAAFKAAMNNKQVAILVPTTILAGQHYQNFIRRIGEFPLNCQMLCRFKTRLEQAEIVKGLKSGRVDIVVGTHRLLSDDISFKDLGLVIIDEEQRFGVKAKEKLKAVRLASDVLTLTATPIPRTLYMSIMGAKDFSIINTPPQNRLPIKTLVVEYDQDLIAQAIMRELRRKGQVYFVHNRIDDIDKVRKKISSLLPAGVRISTGHGQMHPKALERVMADFLNGETQVLICTMIIQSGIDIPNVNTIIVNNAQDFGLSDLHQLRGRVGRFDRPAYAYLVTPRKAAFDPVARKRLEAIEEHSKLGSGFKIAMEDLEIRGAGNILGTQQHGFIAAVGFDLYCRLLREAVGTFRKIGVKI
ncbi:transcription-repair coupling factor [Candidatus Omnitrophota bacterium]